MLFTEDGVYGDDYALKVSLVEYDMVGGGRLVRRGRGHGNVDRKASLLDNIIKRI